MPQNCIESLQSSKADQRGAVKPLLMGKKYSMSSSEIELERPHWWAAYMVPPPEAGLSWMADA
jgi:hypothetical protein